MSQQIQMRRGTAAEWTTANPILAQGEQGFELDTNKIKIGDGTTRWASLTYLFDDVDPVSTGGKNYYEAVVAPTGGDYTTIGAAIAAGAKTIFVKNGTYQEAGDITLVSPLRLTGESRTGVIVNLNGGHVYVAGFGVQIDTLTLTNWSAGGCIVASGGATNPLFENIYFLATSTSREYAIMVDKMTEYVISRCVYRNDTTSTTGIAFGSSQYAGAGKIEHCTMYGNIAMFYQSGADDLVEIESNWMQSTYSDTGSYAAIYMNRANINFHDTRITGNYIGLGANNHSAITLQNISHISVNDNNIQVNQNFGVAIKIINGNHHFIDGNYIISGNKCISIDATSDSNFIGNNKSLATTYIADAGTNTQLAGKVVSVKAGTNVTVDNTDPANPIISSTGGSGGVAGVSSVNTRTGAVTLTKTDVGLANVDNTSDLNKPISTATQTALTGKANTTHTHTESDVTGLTTDLAAKEPTVTAGTISQYYRGDKSWQTLDKTAVGLGNVDNTTDLNKPVSTATQTALNAKENSIAAGITSQYYRGDKSWQTLNKAVVGLANVDNTSDVSKPVSTATQAALDAKEATVTAGTTTQYYRGDKTWQALTKTAVGLANVDNTSDANKPVSTATQTALNGKVSSVVAGSNITVDATDPKNPIISATSAGEPSVTPTNLGVIQTDATDVIVTSDTGTDATIAAATYTAAGVMIADDKTKLDGIATGATANSTDSYLLSRTNHTGTQAISTVSGLQTSLDGKLPVTGTGTGDIAVDNIAAKTGTSIAVNSATNFTQSLKKGGTDVSLAGHTHAVADLQATGTAGVTTFLRGDGAWAAPAAGGGGQTIFDAVVAPTGGDYTSVAAAFDAGKMHVFVRPGTYTETENVSIPTGGSLIGAGPDLVTINLSNNYSIVFNGANTTMMNFTITAWGVSSGIRAVASTSMFYNIFVHRVNFLFGATQTYFRQAIDIATFRNSEISSCNFINASANAVSNALIINNTSASGPAYNSKIINNTWYTTGTGGFTQCINFQGSSSYGNVIANNMMTSTSSGGALITFSGTICSNNVIVNNFASSTDNNQRFVNISASGCNNTIISNNTVSTSGSFGVGVEISAASNNTLITGNQFFGKELLRVSSTTATNTRATSNMLNGTSAQPLITDSGIGTVCKDNVAVVQGNILNGEKDFLYVQNASGAAQATGSVLVWQPSSTSFLNVGTSTTVGDPLVIGVVNTAIGFNQYGYVQTKGKGQMRVDGTTAISAGDFLTTSTTAGVGKKAVAGNTVIAVAQGSYATADANGLINVLVIPPRTI